MAPVVQLINLRVTEYRVRNAQSSRGSWGNAEARAIPKIAIVQKPRYIEATCRLPYEASMHAYLPQNKSNSYLSTRRARMFQWYVFYYFLIHEKLNYSLSMWLFLMLVPWVICLIYAPPNVQAVGEILLHHLNISCRVWWKCRTGVMPKMCEFCSALTQWEYAWSVQAV